jgi:hypothetical protein
LAEQSKHRDDPKIEPQAEEVKPNGNGNGAQPRVPVQQTVTRITYGLVAR